MCPHAWHVSVYGVGFRIQGLRFWVLGSGFREIRGTLSGVPINKGCSISGSILGSVYLNFGKLP